jgi:cysteine synthase A
MSLGTVENIVELVGRTPMLHLTRFARPPLADIYAKLEYMNPGGSVKDRAALGMILDAERRGALKAGATILCVPEGYSREKMKLMEALGGEIEYVPKDAGMAGAIERAGELARDIEDSFIPQQFENPANPGFHEETTAQEIIEQMQGRIDALVVGAGTAGTFTGTARAVKKLNAHALCVLVEPEGSIFGGGEPHAHRIEGIGQLQFIPRNFDANVADEVITISEAEAFAAVRRLAETEGVLGGCSTGAAAAAARRVAERLGAGKRIVTVFPDGAERYMSQGIFDQ